MIRLTLGVFPADPEKIGRLPQALNLPGVQAVQAVGDDRVLVEYEPSQTDVAHIQWAVQATGLRPYVVAIDDAPPAAPISPPNP
ncbi:MAG: hypothetical protein K6U87_12975 [Firmicutes bacterium]|nr:hypothetical protein [Bacillota bacterium]